MLLLMCILHITIAPIAKSIRVTLIDLPNIIKGKPKHLRIL